MVGQIYLFYFLFGWYLNGKFDNWYDGLIIFRNITITEIILEGWLWFIGDKQSYEIWKIITGFLLTGLIHETSLYIVHRFVHETSLYRWHHMHHSKFGPLAAWYCSAVEHIFINMGTVALGFLICWNLGIYIGAIQTQLFAIYGVYSSVNGHNFGSRHELHHLNSKVRFSDGTFILDKIFGTYCVPIHIQW